MNFPPDVVRLIATHLDGRGKINKANVANLAATCQAWRRYLAWHVERHRVLFPRVYLSKVEFRLLVEYRNDCLESAWCKKLAEIQTRFKLVQNVDMNSDFLDFVRDGYIVHIPHERRSKPHYIRVLPDGLVTFYHHNGANFGSEEFVARCKQANKDTRELFIALDNAWRECEDGK